jgi:hypothetical protein
MSGFLMVKKKLYQYRGWGGGEDREFVYCKPQNFFFWWGKGVFPWLLDSMPLLSRPTITHLNEHPQKRFFFPLGDG